MKNSNYRGGYVAIVDAQRKVANKKVAAYRVKSIAANSECMQISEVLASRNSVIKHLKAMRKLYAGDWLLEGFSTMPPRIKDKTKNGVFKDLENID